MTALEYMEKQIQQHRISHIQAVDRNAPEEMLENIRRKISHYEEAAEALRNVVEMVHCKDCKYWADGVTGCTDHAKCCKIGFYMVGENGYCVYGERKDNE